MQMKWLLFTDRVPALVVHSVMIGLERLSVAAATGELHVTVVKERADEITHVVVGQHENETGTRIGPEVDV